MRSLSASIDAASKILLLGLLSCASAPPVPNVPKSAVVEGAISISGSHPYEQQLVLAGVNGEHMLLEAPVFEGELLKLDGQMVRVRGILHNGASGLQGLSVESYELVAPAGLVAAVGLLEARDGGLVLCCDPSGENGIRRSLIVSGPLRGALGHFIGYRIWIAGEREEAGAPGAGGKIEVVSGESGSLEPSAIGAGNIVSRVIVREYGVLGPPIRTDLGTLRSTDPDSCRR
jgi:hypothetical protein